MSFPIPPIPRLKSSATDFESQLDARLDRNMLVADEINHRVADILRRVREEGDDAVLELTQKYDNSPATSLRELLVTRAQMEASLAAIGEEQRSALQQAAERIRQYHEKQRTQSWTYEEADRSSYGQKISPLDRVGIYVPGGKANYPSSMLMLAIPAQVAGVPEIVATVPSPYPHTGEGDIQRKSHLIFAAAAIAGVKQIFTVGGAQAIAALAYGTATIPGVDKIAGPGNVYVTVAKKQLFGEVGIDMIAGPSELTIICDGGTDPDWIAMDLFSQAEHDEQAQSILICPDVEYVDRVEAAISRLLPTMERREIIARSLAERGLFVLSSDLSDAARVSNHIAPEHLELSVENPRELLEEIRHAGAVFLGRYSAEALGDYCAGPSHVLPTSGSARFFSALGVYDFQKRSSIIQCSATGAHDLAGVASRLAREENLQAHALSAEYRIKKD
ncbi:MAG: histidinol dehydrogenase [Pseudohongiella sp.]|nr:MAG: histidinol dehydrogenase [Pseudohongiella sp.]